MLTKKQWVPVKRLTKLARTQWENFGDGTTIVTQEKMLVTGFKCCLETTHRLEELTSELGDKEEAYFTASLKLDETRGGAGFAKRASVELAKFFDLALQGEGLWYTPCTEVPNINKRLLNIEVGNKVCSLPKSVLEDCKTLGLVVKIVERRSSYLLYAYDDCTQFAYALQNVRV